ncbi:MAG TPA: hypothetical protein VJB99_02490 [Patescibacteria group bacterium]|nr:hypothetical protein [Patescibacteria group bacterium]
MVSPHALILGGGRLGSSLRTLLLPQDPSVEIWDVNPARATSVRPLSEDVPEANFLFLCVPSWVLPNVLSDVVPYLSPSAPVICFSKGIERESGKTMDELLPSLLPPHQPFALVGGPMLAEELEQGLGGIGVVATRSPETFQKFSALFRGSCLALASTDDLRGVTLSGVAKNVYATAIGVVQGLGWGGNMTGWIGAQSSFELIEIVERLGGRKETARGPAGLGDFFATAFSPYSNNRQAGVAWAQTGLCNQKSEGVISFTFLSSLLEEAADSLPVFYAMKRILIGCEPMKKVFQELLYGKKETL